MRLLALLVPTVPLTGCYLLHLAEGQLRILTGMRRIREVLADPQVPDPVKKKLRLVLDVRTFARDRMGLPLEGDEGWFYDTRGAPVSHLVSACPRDRFEAYTWWFPIVGRVPYKGFFDPQRAEAEARALQEQGLDVARHDVEAYSTLGWFPDPVYSPLLDREEDEIAEIILHELTHRRLFKPGEVDFSESLATFSGRQGAMEFLRDRHGTGSEVYDRAVRRFAQAELHEARNLDLYRRLEAFYRSAASREDKIALRDQIAGEPVNNAEILMRRRYGRLDLFQRLFERAGGDWNLFFAAAEKAVEMGTSP